MKFIHLFLFYTLLASSGYAQLVLPENAPTRTDKETDSNSLKQLWKRANNYLDQQQYQKAKQYFKSYQLEVNNRPELWLQAEVKLIAITINENKIEDAWQALEKAEKEILKNKLTGRSVDIDLNLLKCEIFEVNNQFDKAQIIYEKIISQYDPIKAKIALANNTIDRLLAQKSSNPKNDLILVEKIIVIYEKNAERDPLELVRVKGKISIFKKVDKQSLLELQKLKPLWMKKDEFAILNIYVALVQENFELAKNIWQVKQPIITRKSHPLAVDVLVKLSRFYWSKDKKISTTLNKILPSLLRDTADAERLQTLLAEQWLQDKNSDKAAEHIDIIKKRFPKSPKLALLQIQLAEIFLNEQKMKKIKNVIANIDKVLNPELQSRLDFLGASVLVGEKDKEAAKLFLKAAQNSKNENLIQKSLFLAGSLFQKTSNFQSAIEALLPLSTKARHQYTDESLARLAVVYAKSKMFAEAINTVDQLIKIGQTPKLKQQALYNKGNYNLAAGKIDEAIKSYEYFTSTYPKDERGAVLLTKVYNLHRTKKKDLVKAVATLDKIIAQCRDTAPDTYSLALSNKAMILNLKGNPRESIKLCLLYLEFNKNIHSIKNDEVKLLLAAAYQNSDDLQSSTAILIYTDLIANSKSAALAKMAIQSLLAISSKDNGAEAALDQLLKLKSPLLDKKNISQIMTWKKRKLSQTAIDKKLSYLGQLITQSKSLTAKKLNTYWTASFIFEKSALLAKEQRTSLLKAALATNAGNTDSRAFILNKELLMALNRTDEALVNCLKVIYPYASQMENDNYTDWQLFHKACQSAVEILISQNRLQEAAKILTRLKAAALPGSDKIILSLSLQIKEKVK